MVNNPIIQAKAQAELDEVIGRDRLPDFTDREQLPYINAMIMETLRWQPVVPLGEHRFFGDYVYISLDLLRTPRTRGTSRQHGRRRL